MPYRPNKQMQDAARVAIEWNEEQPPSGKWGTTTGRRRAGAISRGELLSKDIIIRMYSFLQRHKNTYEAQRASGNYGKGYYAYMGWGGPSALGWAEDKLERYRAAGEL
jgi:hypothetical protein